MTLRNVRPLRFSPAGVSDALAEEDAFPGACAALTNLIPDPSTKNLWTPRPASILNTSFGGFTTPGTVSVFKVVGSLVYGMVANTNTGFDVPFVYNLVTNAFIAVSGTTGSNLPTTQATTGEWTPPTMDVMGVLIVITHPGFDGVTNFIGWIDATNPAAPVWNAGNFTLVTPLVTVTVLTGGSGYTNGTYTNVPLASNPGAGAVGTVVVSSGSVASITVTSGGLGYNFGAAILVSNTVIGSGGTGFAAIVGSVIGSGITGLQLVGPGSSYTPGSYTNVSVNSTSGSGATADFIVNGSGQVSSIVPHTPGGGYIIGSVITVSGHAILTLSSLAGGSGYTNGIYQNVTISGGSGTGALFNITVSGGAVTAVAVSQGGANYIVGDVLTAGSGGIATFQFSGFGGTGFVPPDGTYLITQNSYPYYVHFSTNSGVAGAGASFIIVVSGGLLTSCTLNSAGAGFKKFDQITFLSAPQGGTASFLNIGVLTVAGTGPLASGTGFTIAVATVTAYPIGPGSGFSAQVSAVQNPGGYINFTTVPTWVRQFNGRSWFGINPPTGQPSVILSDVYALNALNASQALQFGDNSPTTAAAPLPLSNLLGGVIQSLIVFKAYTGIIQITGDPTTSNLSVNDVPGGSGTLSPRSVVNHPQGLLYLDHDGYRMITMDGTATDPIGASGSGVSVPLLNPVTRSRVNAACNGSVLRVSLQNSLISGTPWQEYWFDLTRKNWSGPHTFPSVMIDGYAKDFIVAPQSVVAKLFTSAIQPEGATSFVENGVSLVWTYQTVVLMDNQEMAESEIAEMQVKAAPGVLSMMVVNIIDQNGTPIAAVNYTFGSITGLAARQISYAAPVVYNRMAVQITGASAAGTQIGDIYVRARTLGYIQPVA